jgi:hypothetical protein
MDFDEKFLIILYILRIICIILFILAVAMVIEGFSAKTIAVEQTPCFDSYGSVIKNISCEKEIYCGMVSEFFNLERCEGISYNNTNKEVKQDANTK